jgi:deoxyribose-phosphate aldolase
MTTLEQALTRAQLAKLIDHTLLDPAATNHDVLMACEIARRNRTATVCLNSNRVALAADTLKASGVGIAAVVGFPFGAAHMDAKAHETMLAMDDGATEIDMVIDIGRLKVGDLDAVERDIASVVAAADGHLVKVILECSRLTDEEKRTGCRLSLDAGAGFVKHRPAIWATVRPCTTSCCFALRLARAPVSRHRAASSTTKTPSRCSRQVPAGSAAAIPSRCSIRCHETEVIRRRGSAMGAPASTPDGRARFRSR